MAGVSKWGALLLGATVTAALMLGAVCLIRSGRGHEIGVPLEANISADLVERATRYTTSRYKLLIRGRYGVPRSGAVGAITLDHNHICRLSYMLKVRGERRSTVQIHADTLHPGGDLDTPGRPRRDGARDGRRAAQRAAGAHGCAGGEDG